MPALKRPTVPAWRKAAYALCLLPPAFFFGDFAATVLLNRAGYLEPKGRTVNEESGAGPVGVFDPAAGYRMSRARFRTAIVGPDGAIETWGTSAGNNLGFPDERDFFPRRGKSEGGGGGGGGGRVAVLGDSMSAAQFLRRSWPKEAEERCRQRGREIQLLNFSVNGGGIANWHGILSQVLDREDYALDGLIFAVCCDDLYRGLFIAHDDFAGGRHDLFFARIPGLDPDRFPRDLDEARRYFVRLDIPTIPTEAFDDLVAGRRSLSRPNHRFFVSHWLMRRYRQRYFRPQGSFAPPDDFSAELDGLIERMAAIVRRRGWPILVVSIPLRDGIAPQTSRNGPPADVAAFARRLGAVALDGREAFRGLDAAALGACYLRGDPHWSQAGSDRFAGFVAETLATWPALVGERGR